MCRGNYTLPCSARKAALTGSESFPDRCGQRNTQRARQRPGAVATEVPNSISGPDVAAGFQKFYADFAIPADAFARAGAYAIAEPEDMDFNEVLFRPTRQEPSAAD